MLTRRDLLATMAQLSGALVLSPTVRADRKAKPKGVVVNDIQSQINETRVARIVKPDSLDAIQSALTKAKRDGKAVSIAGGRHAMGGQQFGANTVLLDMTGCNRILSLDKEKGLIDVQGGVEWPELIEYLDREQKGRDKKWTIRQKQTGVDRVTMAGSLSANIHGRGLRLPPMVGDVESFVLVDAAGKAHACSRTENRELFSLVIGGYGLFGVIAEVKLRLVPLTKVERVVKVIAVKDLASAIEQRIKEGFEFGDCQYSTDLEGDSASHPGVFSCYRPVDGKVAIPSGQKQLSKEEWTQLYYLARTDKKKAFETYSKYYLSTSGQMYWSDVHQLSGTLDYYHEGLKKLPASQKGTEMLTEVYVTRDELVPFLGAVRKDFLEHKVDLTYGTIRFIEKDGETFLNWARQRCVCIVCNLHIIHSKAGLAKAAEDFRRVIDRAIQHGGRYFLTYHRWATRAQVESCYPQMAEFLKLKKKYDPQESFQSEWYRHYREMFADKL